MKLTNLKGLTIAIALMSVIEATADDGNASHAIGLNLTSFGPGVFYTYKFNDNFHLRVTTNGIGADDGDIELSDIEYEGDFNSSAAGLMLDWYPLSQGWKRNIFFSAGLMYSDMDFEGSAKSKLNEEIRVGGTLVSPGDISSLDLKIESEEEINPYISIGWGNKISGRRGFAFVTEIGLMDITDPIVTLSANDPDGILNENDLETEKDAILDDFDGLDAFLSVGVSYHF